MINSDNNSGTIRFTISNELNSQFMTLKPDYNYQNTYNFNSSVSSLTEHQIDELITEMIEFIPVNYYLSITGSQTEQSINLFKHLTYRTTTFKDTNCVSKVMNNYSNEFFYLPIL